MFTKLCKAAEYKSSPAASIEIQIRLLDCYT
jgi:hypothetical protein